MKAAFFVTGTDTDAGKTLCVCALLHRAKQSGSSTAAVKPLAAGMIDTPVGRCNGDAVMLRAQCTVELGADLINPVCFEPAIAPHIAAEKQGRTLNADLLAVNCREVLDLAADLTLIEGAGGWRVPLNRHETLADLAVMLNIPVILVVGMRLGCLNHALLTAEAIRADGLRLAGWIANRIDPGMAMYAENLATLRARLGAPLLGEIPWLDSADPARAGEYLSLEKILG